MSQTSELVVEPVIFKAYDIRGIVGETLTTETVYQIGRAIGSQAQALGQQCVLVARDGRLSSPEFADLMAKGLQASGCDVIDIGCVPTPVLYFATHFLDTGSGVMVTGSHNPSNYNGFKIVLAGKTLAEEAIQGLYQRIVDQDFTGGQGGRKFVDVVPEYLARICTDIKTGRSLKIVVDCGNGAASEVAPRLLRKLGCELTELYCVIDGTFPNHHPDPSRPANLQDLITEVRNKQADLGLAFDGDGDRLGVIDSAGNIIWPDRQMMLYATDILSRQANGTVVFDVKCSRHLARVIEQHGGQPLMWKTGHSLMKAKIKETNAVLGGEMSGHIFFSERWYGFDDALYTAARLIEIVSASAKSSAGIFAELPDSVSTPELNLKMSEGMHHEFMKRLIPAARFDDGELTTIDGLRVDFENGWGLVRASNTTPCLVIRFEANDQQALEQIQQRFRKLLLSLDPGLDLPF